MDDSELNELNELFTDPADQEVIDLLRAARPATPPLDPHFRGYLRAKLMTEARRTLPAQERRSWFGLGRGGLVPAMAAVAAGFLVVLGVEVYLQNQTPATPALTYNVGAINNKKDVATAEPIQISFTGPVNKTAVEETVQIQPATSFTKRWDGTTLVIVPDHKLAPNTSYTVTFKPQALAPPPPAKPTATPLPTPVPTPVVVRFRTAPAPIPPVVQPTYRSGSVTYGYDQRLQTSGSMLSAVWTPDGQLLVTRPAGQGSSSPSPTPSGTPTPAASPASKALSDVWLMSAGGTYTRQLAPGGSLPAVAPAGGLFADWQVTSPGQATLEVRDLQGVVQSATLATIQGSPDRAPIWVGPNRLAYLDHGILKIVDLRGAPVPIASEVKIASGASLAASPDGLLLAVESTGGSMVLDFSAARAQLPTAATGFAWSAKDSLAFAVPRQDGTDLYVAADGKRFARIAQSPTGQLWSDFSWAPDGVSILFGTRPASGTATQPGLMLINADGTAPTAFGPPQQEYATPTWSPRGDLILFTRRDEAGGRAFWTASASLGSATDSAEKAALAEVDAFMQARIRGDAGAAQSELSDNARGAYQGGSASLLSPAGSKFSRYYVVSVQLTAPDRFLIGARVFSTRGGQQEVSFFEEQLAVIKQGQRDLIDAVTPGAMVQLGHGPTVVSVEVRQDQTGQHILVRFDSDLKPESVTRDTVKLLDGRGNPVDAQLSFDPDAHLVTLSSALRSGTYQLAVTQGVTDISGASIAQDYTAPVVIGSAGQQR